MCYVFDLVVWLFVCCLLVVGFVNLLLSLTLEYCCLFAVGYLVFVWCLVCLFSLLAFDCFWFGLTLLY